MFKNEYQGGSHVEVFSAQGRDPVSKWRLLGSVKKEYCRDIKGYVYVLEGGSSTTTTRMQFPKNEKASLGLLQPLLVFQIMIPEEARLAIELLILDGAGSRRRVQFSTSLKEVSATPLNARVPLVVTAGGQWLNLCLDLQSLTGELFHRRVYKSLEGISVGGNCKMRRIFTLKPSPTPSEQKFVEIPRGLVISTDSVLVHTQIIDQTSCESLASSRHHQQQHSTAGGLRPGKHAPSHVAFGTKIDIPAHILRHSSTPSSLSSESLSDKSVSTVGDGISFREGVASGRGLVPRPPLHPPVDPQTMKIQKNRLRVLSGRGGGRGRGISGRGRITVRQDRKQASPEMEREMEKEREGEGEEEKQQAKEEKEEEEELLIDALQQLDTRDGRPPYPLLSDPHDDNHPHDHSRERRRRRVGDEEAVAHSGEPLAPLATEGDAAHQSSSNIICVCTSAKATTDDENVDDGVMDATLLTGDASAAIDASHTPAGQSIDDDDDGGGEYDRNQFPTDVVSADSSVVTSPGCGHAYHTAHYSEDGPQSMPPTTNNKDDEDGYDPDFVPCSSPDSIPDSSFVETKKLQAFYSDEQRSSSVVSGSPSADGTYYYYSSPKSAARRRPLRVVVGGGGGGDGRQSDPDGLEEDFLSHEELELASAAGTTALAQQQQPQCSTASTLGSEVPTATRLSDDYDWRRYSSSSGDNNSSSTQRKLPPDDSSSPLHARGEGGELERAGAEALTVVDHSPSSSSEKNTATNTLSGSMDMTVTGWTEDLRANQTLMDSLEFKQMGGSMSPVMEMDIGGGWGEGKGGGGEGGGGGGGESWQEEEGEGGGDVDELELVYDSQLNCFYDPFTSKYYELIQ